MARVRPSPTSAALALAAELKAAGRDLVSLGAGEPDFDTPQHVKAAAIAAIHAGVTKYTPIDGTAQLKAAIQRKFARTEDRILFGVADTTKAILTFLEGAPVLSRKAGDWA